MAKGINKVILVGNLGQDPEVRYSQAGAAITNISIATTDSWTDKQSGQRQDRTEWHRVVFFNRLAEVAGEYLRKGSQVYIEGALRTRKWQDQQGQDKYTTEIVASEMQMLGSRGDSAGGAPMGGGMGGGYNQQPAQPNYGASQQSQQQPQQQGGYGQPAPQNAPPQQQSYSQNSAPQAPPAQPQSAPPQPAPAPKPSMDSFDDDIPF